MLPNSGGSTGLPSGASLVRERCVRCVVILEVASQNVTQVALAEDNDVVETVAPDRADQAFGEGILPRTLSGREDLLDPHALHTSTEGVTVDGVSVAKEIGRGGVVGKGVHDLLSSLRHGGMLGEVEVQDPTSMVSEHDEDEEHPQLSGGDGEEVDRDQIADMVREERAPGLRGRCRSLRDQTGDRPLRLSFAIILSTLLRDARDLTTARVTTVGKSVMSLQTERGHPQGEHST
jgi:hypothetical protein